MSLSPKALEKKVDTLRQKIKSEVQRVSTVVKAEVAKAQAQKPAEE